MTNLVDTALAAAYAHGPGKSVRVPNGTPSPGGARPGRGIDLAELADLGPFGPALVRALSAALAPQRWEPWNPYNDHRAYPSPRCAYLTDATLRLGEDRRLLDPVRLVLAGERPLPDPSSVDSVGVELTVAPHRLPAGYGALRDALAFLEAGHLAAALVEAGAPAATAVLRGAGGASGVVAQVAFRMDPAPAGRSRGRVGAVRSSALAPRGLSADPRPLPAEVLRRLIADGRPPAGSPAARSGPGGLRHRLAVRGVTGCADGLYELREGGPVLRAAGPITEYLQAAFGFGPADVDVSGMNVVWVSTAEVAAVVRDRGPDGYPNVLMTAGAAAQHVCSAAAGAGLFCRPVRSYAEGAVEAAVRAEPGEDVVYMLLIGRPRVPDFCYDLTDPEQPR
ncbi:hypothetical protein [Embleya sp. AB8]|uniref:hypothetical protein n=1 Tax=Embleya sp. AB8 TaxID=3156304 RepID=UPI003C786006